MTPHRATLTLSAVCDPTQIHALLHFDRTERLAPAEGLCYDTEITDDVIGYIENLEELNGYLERIKALPSIL